MAEDSAQDSEYKQCVITRANVWDINTPSPVAGNLQTIGKVSCCVLIKQTLYMYVMVDLLVHFL